MEDLLTPGEGPAREKLNAEKRQEMRELEPVIVPGSGLAAAFYCFAAFAPRRKWGWGVGMGALIGSLFPFGITAIPLAPLLIFWLKPATKRYFGYD